MSTVHATRNRCLFFGMPCAFSSPILIALARPDVELVGVVTPNAYGSPEPYRILPHRSAGPSLPMAGGYSQFDAPRFLVRDIRDNGLHRALRALRPDLIVVACFPWRIPEVLTTSARLAALNIHPSLLPNHRGPDPLFWTFRAGDTHAGVTLHLLSHTFDAGPIIAQAATPIAPDESLAALEQRLAGLGSDLLGRLIDGLPALPDPHPQQCPPAHPESTPESSDLEFDAGWTVDHARRFIAGVARSHGPLRYRTENGSIPVHGLSTAGSGVEILLRDGQIHISIGNPDNTPRDAFF